MSLAEGTGTDKLPGDRVGRDQGELPARCRQAAWCHIPLRLRTTDQVLHGCNEGSTVCLADRLPLAEEKFGSPNSDMLQRRAEQRSAYLSKEGTYDQTQWVALAGKLLHWLAACIVAAAALPAAPVMWYMQWALAAKARRTLQASKAVMHMLRPPLQAVLSSCRPSPFLVRTAICADCACFVYHLSSRRAACALNVAADMLIDAGYAIFSGYIDSLGGQI